MERTKGGTGGIDLAKFEISAMADRVPKHLQPTASFASFLATLHRETDPAKQAEVRRKLRDDVQLDLEAFALNALDLERFIDVGNICRHELFSKWSGTLKSVDSLVRGVTTGWACGIWPKPKPTTPSSVASP